ncbi:hypothetical protein [Rudaeicoccus suwonensis]|uniref:hypothetical protein n=1 Tax=Rudaeicoccus suwonensis TaxID=657409 RepID=UPI0011A159AE|nr:hypothetical protein [Rudaeicoccus suwonensis]
MIKRRLQLLKHRAYLAYKPYRFPVAGALEPAFRAAHRIKPVHFDPLDWPDTHLPHDEPLTRETTEPIPRQIFCFWTGSNPLTENRRRSLDAIRRMNGDLDVRLITPATMDEFVVPEHPLHPAYEHLSLIHRSDYLRCYAMHVHGGGYADIKAPFHPWTQTFELMDRSSAWMAGYRVPVRLMTPNMTDPALELVMRRCSELRLGQCSYICRPDTPLTKEWWRELNLRLDHGLTELAAHPGNARGDNADYPLQLNEILAQIIDPLEVKYRRHLLYSASLFVDHSNYL